MVKGNYVFYYSCTQTLQDAQCAPGKQQEDGCRGGQAEGQGEEGGGNKIAS